MNYNSFSCEHCEPGTFKFQHGSSPYWECTPGNFSTGVGDTICQDCTVDTYSENYGQYICSKCQDGSYPDILRTSCTCGSTFMSHHFPTTLKRSMVCSEFQNGVKVYPCSRFDSG